MINAMTASGAVSDVNIAARLYRKDGNGYLSLTNSSEGIGNRHSEFLSSLDDQIKHSTRGSQCPC